MENELPALPTHSLTDRQLKLSYWYITHKLAIRKWLKIFLIMTAILLWAYVLWQLIFFIKDYNAEQNNLRQLIVGANPALENIDSQKPQAPTLSEIHVLGGENGRYDFVAQITNSNKSWLLTFDYKFSDGSAASSTFKKGFVLPGEQKFLMDLGRDNSDSQLEIANQKWQKIQNPEVIINQRLRLEIIDQKFQRAVKAGEPNRAQFTINNLSAYGYWEVGSQVFLYSGGNLIAVNYLTLTQLKAGESREVEVFWNYPLRGVDEVVVIPDLNVFDADNIMPPGFGEGVLRDISPDYQPVKTK